jgi:hypothetical protein
MGDREIDRSLAKLWRTAWRTPCQPALRLSGGERPHALQRHGGDQGAVISISQHGEDRLSYAGNELPNSAGRPKPASAPGVPTS